MLPLHDDHDNDTTSCYRLQFASLLIMLTVHDAADWDSNECLQATATTLLNMIWTGRLACTILPAIVDSFYESQLASHTRLYCENDCTL